MIPKPLTHEERRRLIEMPLTVRVYGGGRWSGTCTIAEKPEDKETFWHPNNTRWTSAYSFGNSGSGKRKYR